VGGCRRRGFVCWSVSPESSLTQARRMFWPAVTSDWRAWVCLVACGIGGTAAGAYLSWGHGQAGTVVLTVVSAVGGVLVALLAIFAALWSTAPYRLIRARVNNLEAQVAELPSATGATDEEQIRVALFAVRSELGACATRITDAQEAGQWWDPDIDPLPATQWERHFGTLTRLPDNLNAEIDITYQRCDRLNHLARWYLERATTADDLSGHAEAESDCTERLRRGTALGGP
jgi:hypothetical protein